MAVLTNKGGDEKVTKPVQPDEPMPIQTGAEEDFPGVVTRPAQQWEIRASLYIGDWTRAAAETFNDEIRSNKRPRCTVDARRMKFVRSYARDRYIYIYIYIYIHIYLAKSEQSLLVPKVERIFASSKAAVPVFIAWLVGQGLNTVTRVEPRKA